MNFEEQPDPVLVAIIGMDCLFPKAEGLDHYWANIKNKVDAITEIPASHWRPEDYFDKDPKAPDHTYAHRGGFLSPVDFPALEFGISPRTLEATDTSQLLGLMVARRALEDAGYGSERKFDRQRVSVILGVTGTLELVIPLGARLGHPIWRRALKEAGVDERTTQKVVEKISSSYVNWQEDSFPGLLGNVVAGRIANRLDLGGTNCVVDAACASSLSALHLGLLELSAGRCDMVLSGGMDTFNDIFMYMCFSKTPALSPTGNARPFDANGDGTILGEGLGVVVLKRLKDAERDGDKIYAVIRAVGSSSDGKGQAIYAPSPAGQAKALNQAYRLAHVAPDTIELLEAHGTGTKAGDLTEATALIQVFEPFSQQGGQKPARKETTESQDEPTPPWCALGSVKSQIGHTKAAAGAASLLKTALALHHKILPPTIKVDEPVEILAGSKSPFYLNLEKRPWLSPLGHPRRGALSSFGFGGSNFHCVLEEYRPDKAEIDWDGGVQIVALSRRTKEEVRHAVHQFPRSEWGEIRTAARLSRNTFDSQHPFRLLLVIERDKSDITKVFSEAGRCFDAAPHPLPGRSSQEVFHGIGSPTGGLGILFSGQGSQYPGMFRDLACHFPQMQRVLDEANRVFEEKSLPTGRRLSDFIYPPYSFKNEVRENCKSRLQDTQIAQPAIGAVELGAWKVLNHFKVKGDAFAGHSFGELVALHAAGRYQEKDLFTLAVIRGRLMSGGTGEKGSMLAVRAPQEVVMRFLEEEKSHLVVANKNAPDQFVLSGSSSEIKKAAASLQKRSVSCVPLAVSGAFHSSLVADSELPLREALKAIHFSGGEAPVFANTTGARYPADVAAATELLAGQLARPVEFMDLVRNMAKSGIDTFLEVGPGNKLGNLVQSILGNDRCATLALDSSAGKRSGFVDLARVLCELAASGRPLDLGLWDPADARATQEKEGKPTLTVKICGANYVAPQKNKAPSVPIAPETKYREVSPAGASLKDESPRNLPSSNGEKSAFASLNVEKTIPHKPSNGSSNIPKAMKPPVNNSWIGQVFQTTQENLLALQKLGEQTAQIHKQFLDGQSKSLEIFQSLLQQQQRFFQNSTAEVVAPEAAIAPSRSVPLPQSRQQLESFGHKGSNGTSLLGQDRSTTVTKPEISAERLNPALMETLPISQPEERSEGTAQTPIEVTLLGIVSEKTGYPPEMLELDMELDSDLGIDSIKRVEIFSALQESLPHAPAVKPEHIGTLRTLRHVVQFLQSESSPTSVAVIVSVAEQPSKGRLRESSQAIVQTLLQVVSEKTGYPPEMLELPMELDSDLGIDSIKRVEIFSALQEKLPAAPLVKPEHLGTLRTLQHVVNFLSEGTEAFPGQSEPVSTETRQAPAKNGSAEKKTEILSRYILKSVALTEKGGATLPIPVEEEFWITDDGSRLPDLIGRRLETFGIVARTVSLNQISSLEVPPRLGGLIILSPVGKLEEDFLLDSFLLSKKVAGSLRITVNSVFITVSRMDGTFGINGFPLDVDPRSGGLAGLSKTAAHEWPEVHCKTLDVDCSLPTEEAAQSIAEEVFLLGPREIGIESRERIFLELDESPLPEVSSSFALSREDVVIVSGGARGVTAEVAAALAKNFSMTLVLIGRSPDPILEPDWLASLVDGPSLKKAILDHASGKLTPREVEDQFRSIIAGREIRETKQRLAAFGSRVFYFSADICDAKAIESLVKKITSEIGRVTGIVHGAGVLADRFIEDKTEQQFRKVYETKVNGLRSLLNSVEIHDLKLLALFSSSTARFGRQGQVDYAMANEVLNKTAQKFSRELPSCRVLSINWGPWDGGMVSSSLKKIFEGEGVGLIPLGEGGEYFIRELGHDIGPAEVLVLNGRVETNSAVARPSFQEAFAVETPLQDDDVIGKNNDQSPGFTETFHLDLSVDQFPVLKSHVMDGRAVLPMALTMEWLAQAALHDNPGLLFHGFEDLRILRGIKLTSDQSCLVRFFGAKPFRRDGFYLVPLEMRSIDKDEKEILNARATCILTSRLPSAERGKDLNSLNDYSLSLANVYRNLLFHGTDLHGIREVLGCSEKGICATVSPAPRPAEWLRKPLRNTWVIDPLVLDSAFQLMILWSFEQLGKGSLPTTLGIYRQYRRSFPKTSMKVVARIKKANQNRAFADIDFLDDQGQLVARIEDYECIIDASLNQAFRRNQLSRVALPLS